MIPDIQINQYLFCIVQFSLNFSITRFSLSMSSLLHTREQQTECSDFTLFEILKQILSHQKVITHHWIQWKKTNYLSYQIFRNIFGIKDFGHKNLRVLVLFLKCKCSMRCSRSSQLKYSVISVLQHFINNCVYKLKPNYWNNIW